jgi:hypothetical protein
MKGFGLSNPQSVKALAAWGRRGYDLGMPIRDKYEPLGAYLRRQGADHSDISLTFAEIERIVETLLPQGAQSAPFWQGVNGKMPPRARAWTRAGYVAQPDVQHGRIRFHRQAAGPAAARPVDRAPRPAERAPRPGERR